MSLDHAISLEALARRATDAFTDRFGRPPTVVAAAPGRVNLIGEHTDYNDGFVLPMAIERYTVVAADHATHGVVRLSSSAIDEPAELSPTPGADDAGEGWTRYVRGVLDAYCEAGHATPSLDAVIDSTVPLGGGLSSSAALEVGLATAIEALSDWSVEPARKARLSQRAEHLAGMPCGIMDQFSSALCDAGQAMLLDCRDDTYTMKPLADPAVAVLITNSNVKHELTGGEYAERREQCEAAAKALGVGSLRDATLDQLEAAGLEDVLHRRARHVITEIERTLRAGEAIDAADWPEFGRLMYASHASLRDDYEVSCPELDALVVAAEAVGADGGVYGSRMTGGGFGGCTVSLVRTADVEAIAGAIADDYRTGTGIEATQFVTRPARGAHLIAS